VKSLPVIDVAPLVSGTGDPSRVASEIDRASREVGFFYVVGHGIDGALVERLESSAREFFALPDAEKAAIAMEHGDRAWRGWFPVGGELTSGLPDLKEGIYFGAELGPDDPRVQAGWPLHGPNLFPRRPPELRRDVLAYLAVMTSLGHQLVAGLGLALGLGPTWFDEHLTADPLVLFRIFHYPTEERRYPSEESRPPTEEGQWGVAEHTDYGLLTLLLQDATGGLEVRTPQGWVDAPPIPDSFVCNLGDMLERLTDGAYRSTPHRVRNASGTSRLSFPFFFDPGWDVDVPNLGATYGDYVVQKVSKVFPLLGSAVLDDAGRSGSREEAR
jgi:isopenicillin N synthase-like dioxygenase